MKLCGDSNIVIRLPPECVVFGRKRHKYALLRV